jgi:hypothetical protein
MLAPSMVALSSISLGIEPKKPTRIHVASGIALAM